MTDIRRTLLWVVFTMSLVLLWDAWNKHNGHPTMFGMPTAKPAASAAGTTPGAVAASGVPAAIASAGGTPVQPGVPTAAAVPASETVTIETDVVRATLDSRGGTVVGLELLKYADQNDPTRQVKLLDQSATRVYLAQSGLIAQTAGISLPNHLTPMRVLPGERQLGDKASEVSVSFESTTPEGLTLRKTLRFPRGGYTIGVTHEVVNGGATAVNPQLYLQLSRDGNKPEGESSFYFTFTGPAVYSEATKFKKIDFGDITKDKVQLPAPAKDGWVAMVQHYFTSAWLLPEGAEREFRTAKVADNLFSVALVTPLGDLAPGASTTQTATLYVGPQEEYKLAALAPGLELVKDYGWLTILSKPLFWVLTKLHGFLGNWGWAIISLVVLLKIAFYWLNASAYRSMAKMKAINPKVMEMRERLKDKPQQMQQEMMRIYREEKVNPLGGCLPIVAQMPFFIALYWVLLSSVEMRNAPWIGWIHDLAAVDPFYILPILMTASSLFQVWLNPTPPDPVQAKMMWIMPLAFGVMFFFFPAGLVLYWLTNNILSIAQQWFINKQLGVIGK
ncbi:MAG: membrane protein insertase YidC [Burkholderiaceae bacterium]|nr:membrane protein insertase YidC [Burkholderiaceae bacterium]